MPSAQNGSGISRRSQRFEDKVRRPKISAEIAKAGSALSGTAQTEFLEVLDATSGKFRNLLFDAALIQRTNLENTDLNSDPIWQDVPSLRVGFIAGEVSNATSPDAASPAIKVGSCVLVLGNNEPDRKPVGIDFDLHPVHELYESAAGVDEDHSEHAAKLIETARIACEMAGILSLLKKQPPLDVIVLHDSLVNPVSPLASVRPGDAGAFPNFAAASLPGLLADMDCAHTGKSTNFISVYLEQLNRMAKSNKTVCGLVEQVASRAPGVLTKALLQRLVDESVIDLAFQRQFLDSMFQYGIGDTILFECVLDEGEFAEPVKADLQDEGRIPGNWDPEIQSFPKPLITYAKAHADMMPVRIESFPGMQLNSHQLTRLIIKVCR